MKASEYKAVITDLVDDERSKHEGPYVVLRVINHPTLKSATAFLVPEVWEDKDMPSRAAWLDWRGTYVVISKLRKKRRGWRALHVRLFTPEEDEAEQTAKQY